MLETTVEYLDGVKFSVNSRGHVIVCDQPAEHGGEDCGMTPPEFLLAALGTCAGFYAAQYLKARSLPVEGLRVRVEAEKAQQPARLGSFLIEVTAPHADDERHGEGLRRAVERCLIHKTLAHPPKIAIDLRAPALATT